jgi:hypothetical protein
MGYELSTNFIKKPHEWDPRRLYSQTGADWQYRVDFDRMRAVRLQRTREQMEAYDLGALVLFAGANIRGDQSSRATRSTTSTSGMWFFRGAASRYSSRRPDRTSIAL